MRNLIILGIRLEAQGKIPGWLSWRWCNNLGLEFRGRPFFFLLLRRRDVVSKDTWYSVAHPSPSLSSFRRILKSYLHILHEILHEKETTTPELSDHQIFHLNIYTKRIVTIVAKNVENTK